jgi:peptidoglycan/xylan/chitin deacetylase (PgdA/CDA1 family)
MTFPADLERPLPLLPVEVGRLPHCVLQMLSQEGLPWQARGSGPPCRFLLWDSRRERLRPAPGQRLLDVGPLVEALPREVLCDRGWARPTRWWLGEYALCEETSAIDRRSLRRQFASGLRRLLEHAGGLWLTISPYPAPYRSLFGFRLDHDRYCPEDFAAVLQAIHGHEAAVSHYVNADGHAAAPAALAFLRGWHVGSHGFWHHTYHTFPENLHNLQRGIAWLEGQGIVPVGCVAPHGRYHRGLAEALDRLGVDHSSEFALAWDELPFYPAGSRVLQVPVHPVCLGLVLEAAERAGAGPAGARRAANAMADHFVRLVDERRAAGEPLILYGHPDGRLGRFPHVLRRALESAASHRDCWMANLAEIARWWRARLEVRLQVEPRPAGCAVRALRLPRTFAVACVVHRGGTWARFTLRSSLTEVRWDELMFEPLADAQPRGLTWCAGPLRRSWREWLRAYLDWERTTPVAELRRGGLRGWAKRKLRQMVA